MRQTDIEDPVDDNLLNAFKVLTKEDIANDPSWKTAPVVVCSNDERHSLNMLILQNFAIEKHVPILTWSKDISDKHDFVKIFLNFCMTLIRNYMDFLFKVLQLFYSRT